VLIVEDVSKHRFLLSCLDLAMHTGEWDTTAFEEYKPMQKDRRVLEHWNDRLCDSRRISLATSPACLSRSKSLLQYDRNTRQKTYGPWMMILSVQASISIDERETLVPIQTERLETGEGPLHFAEVM